MLKAIQLIFKFIHLNFGLFFHYYFVTSISIIFVFRIIFKVILFVHLADCFNFKVQKDLAKAENFFIAPFYINVIIIFKYLFSNLTSFITHPYYDFSKQFNYPFDCICCLKYLFIFIKFEYVHLSILSYVIIKHCFFRHFLSFI